MATKKVPTEGILLLIVGFAGIVEGFLLTIHKVPRITYDILGPGFYILCISFAIIISGVAYLIIHYREAQNTEIPRMKKVGLSKETRVRVISMIVILAIYNFLLSYIGYFLASIIFFFLEFRLAGIKSWALNVILTLAFTITYYIVFVQYCNVVFPRGTFIR